jgi:hypothetical protein
VSQALRRMGTRPKVVAAVLGHARVNLAMEVYDHVGWSDLEPALDGLAVGLVPKGTKSRQTALKSLNCMVDGERGRNRTYNLLIKSQLLCQLSYAP